MHVDRNIMRRIDELVLRAEPARRFPYEFIGTPPHRVPTNLGEFEQVMRAYSAPTPRAAPEKATAPTLPPLKGRRMKF